ncbi:ATP-binding cassette domain-containing protein [Bacillota bacterium Meth-B3]|nr:branched-chain amino acid ABC transporter ATP-binding protein/permease [Christensenellaceae bacterium]MEA5067655.1 branched-chain amino acid ABC transporter ATP-binding protein/permease [Christensenellaceae bacterium]
MLEKKKKNAEVLIGILAIILLPLATKNSNYFLHILFLVAIKAYLAVSWNIMSGFSGQMSLGHSAFVGVGAYFSTILYVRGGLNPWLAMVLAALTVALIGVALGLAIFRLRSAFFALGTMALVTIARQLMIYFKDFTNGSQGFSYPVTNDGLAYIYFPDSKLGYVYIALTFLVVALFAAYKISRSKLGLDLFSLRDDHDAASSLGVDTMGAKLWAMGISCLMVSMGGSLYAHYCLYIDPSTIFDAQIGMDMVTMTMLGGIGTLWGPVIGAVLLVPLDTLLRAILGGGSWAGADLIIYGAALIAVIRFCPMGLLPLLKAKLGKRFGIGKPEASEPGKRGGANAQKDADTASVIQAPPQTFDGPILKVENLCMYFGGLKAVENVSFEVNPGEIFGIIGPNGAGKTTIFNAITGFFKPTGGAVCYMGHRLKNGVRPNQLAKLGLTRTFQSVKPFFRMNVRQSVMAGVMLRNRDFDQAAAIADEILDILGLAHRADKLPSNLTVAEQKRLDMARALATNPRLLMLDEPMAGLTDNEVNELIGIIRSLVGYGITVIVIEHVMRAVMNLCDRVIVLDHGEIICVGAPGEVVKDPHVIEVYLGEKIDD